MKLRLLISVNEYLWYNLAMNENLLYLSTKDNWNVILELVCKKIIGERKDHFEDMLAIIKHENFDLYDLIIDYLNQLYEFKIIVKDYCVDNVDLGLNEKKEDLIKKITMINEILNNTPSKFQN